MISVKPFKGVADLKPFTLQKEQGTEEGVEALEGTAAQAYVVENETETLCIIYFLEQGGGRITTGCYMSEKAGPYFLKLKRIYERLLKFYPYKRLEAIVRSDFKQGVRMVGLLGFEFEGCMKAFYNGKNYDLFARYQ